MTRFDTLFLTKTAKTIPFGARTYLRSRNKREPLPRVLVTFDSKVLTLVIMIQLSYQSWYQDLLVAHIQDGHRQTT